MTTEPSPPQMAARTVVVRGCRPGDERLILAAMRDALDRGDYDAVESYQLEAAAGRLPHHPASCAVAEVDGRLAGWVIPGDDDLMVLPDARRRGVGRRLVEAGRAIAAAEGREQLQLWVPRRAGPEAFARASGLRYSSSLWQMRLGGDARSEPPVLPPGLTARSLRFGSDEESFVELVNTIFLDHPSPLRLDLAEVRRVHAMPGFDPSTILVVEQDGEAGRMVGFCRVHRFTSADGAEAGEIRLLGVRRELRGRGLGRALTAWGIAELRRRGAASVVLAVEGENHGALRLYEQLGFRPVAEWPHWTVRAAATAG